MTAPRIVSTLIAVAMASCTQLPDAPQQNSFSGNYAKIAACYFESERRVNTTGIHLNDLRGTNSIIVSREMHSMYTTMPLYDVRFSAGSSPNETIAEIRILPSLLGAISDRPIIEDRIRACSR